MEKISPRWVLEQAVISVVYTGQIFSHWMNPYTHTHTFCFFRSSGNVLLASVCSFFSLSPALTKRDDKESQVSEPVGGFMCQVIHKQTQNDRQVMLSSSYSDPHRRRCDWVTVTAREKEKSRNKCTVCHHPGKTRNQMAEVWRRNKVSDSQSLYARDDGAERSLYVSRGARTHNRKTVIL